MSRQSLAITEEISCKKDASNPENRLSILCFSPLISPPPQDAHESTHG